MNAPDLTDIAHKRARLWECGYRPIPLLSHTDPDKTKAGKAPLQKDWPDRACRNPPEAAVTPAQVHLANTGILCDGLRLIDVDVDDPARADAIELLAIQHLGGAPTRRRDNSSRFAMLYRAAKGTPGKRTLRGTTGNYPKHPDKVEVLGKGQQFVAYGTHVTGGSIYWTGLGPLDMAAGELPAVSEDAVTAFLHDVVPIIKAPEPRRGVNGGAKHHRPIRTNGAANHAELFRLNSALDSLPAELADDYEQWILIGCALHHATRGSLAGRALWDRWSQQSDKYDGNEIAARWVSFARRSGDQASAGTIFHFARQHGWAPPRPDPPAEWEDHHPPVGTPEFPGRSRSKPHETLSPAVVADENGILPPEFSENALAHLFTARHADTLIYVHEWGQWMHWDGRRWREDHAVGVYDKARAICAEQGKIAVSVLKRTGAKVARAVMVCWRGRVYLFGYDGKDQVIPVFLPQKHMTFWKREIGFATHPPPDFPREAKPRTAP